jgi:hypothetical protein
MQNMKIEYAKIIPDLYLEGKPALYPVVNEREIRAAAGIMFVLGFTTFLYTLLTSNYLFMYIIVPIFWLDFFLKTFFSANWSIFGFLGRIITRKQKPEYVGAIQKRFAWGIGLAMASIMLIFAVFLNVRGILPFSICAICLFFMWLESSCGICAGCSMYGMLIKHKIIKEPEYKPVCPGGVCSIDKK